MHLRIYREDPAILAVAHAHPPVAAAFAAAGIPLDRALLQEAVVLLGVIPVAPYAMPGSDALAESVVPYLAGYNGLLLEHHGRGDLGRERDAGALQAREHRVQRTPSQCIQECWVSSGP